MSGKNKKRRRVDPDAFLMIRNLVGDGDLQTLEKELPRWDLNTKKADGVRLIHVLCHDQLRQDAFRLFLSHDVEVNPSTGYGTVPIVIFCNSQPLNLEGLKCLIEYGADPNLYDEENSANALDMVLRREADPQMQHALKNDDVHDQLKELGWESSFQPVIDYLISVGAKRSDAEDLADMRGQYDLHRWSTSWALMLVNADAKATVDAVRKTRDGEKFEPLAAGEYEMQLPDMPDNANPAVIVQLNGHDWSHVVTAPEPTIDDAIELSIAIGQSPVVWMIYDDTSECFGWRVLKNGEIIEELDTGIGMDMQARFTSKRRRKRPRSFRNEEAMWEFISDSLSELNALLAHSQLGFERGSGWSLSGPFNEKTVGAAYLVA